MSWTNSGAMNSSLLRRLVSRLVAGMLVAGPSLAQSTSAMHGVPLPKLAPPHTKCPLEWPKALTTFSLASGLEPNAWSQLVTVAESRGFAVTERDDNEAKVSLVRTSTENEASGDVALLWLERGFRTHGTVSLFFEARHFDHLFGETERTFVDGEPSAEVTALRSDLLKWAHSVGAHK